MSCPPTFAANAAAKVGHPRETPSVEALLCGKTQERTASFVDAALH
jgi:hypothetical protein